MADRGEFEVTIEEAGCLLYVADLGLGGEGFGRFDELYSGDPAWPAVLAQGAIMPVSLYQDDGYTVRFVTGQLTEQEASEWTSRVVGKLSVPSGTLVLSGICTPDLDDELEEFPAFTSSGSSYELGVKIAVPPGDYQATILGYPPNDLSGGWMRIEDPDLFREGSMGDPGEDDESAVAYFERTRPGEPVPEWVAEGYEEAEFLDFVVQLTPLSEDLPAPAREEDGCLDWEFRKPEICPLGIRL